MFRLQKHLHTLLVCILILSAQLFSNKLQAQLISFNPATSVGFGASPWNPPAVLGTGLTTTGLIRGSAITTSGTPAGGCYGGSGGWSASGADANSFYFTITAGCSVVSLSSLNGFTRRSGTGPSGCNIYYSLNGGAYVFVANWTTTSTSGTTGTAGNTVLSGITALQNIAPGTTIKFIFNPTGTTGNWYFTNTSLALSGTSVAVTAPTIAVDPANSSILAGAGTTFTVSGVTDAASYQWQRNTSGISGGTWVDISSAAMDPIGTYAGYTVSSTATSNTLTLSTVPAAWDGYGYRCVVTNCAGTATSLPALLNVTAATCSGTPASGTAVPASTNFCGSGASSLSLSGATVGGGITYQWSSSIVNVPPGTPIAGATAATYTTGTLTDTTYFWCTTTCTTTSLSAISAAGIINIHALPVVTATGGSLCAGSAAIGIAAGGAASYSWAPVAGLSATTGSAVSANPVITTVYTVTGTDANGCIATDTAIVNYDLPTSPLVITPSSLSACQGSAVQLIAASGGLVGPTTVNSGTITLPATITAFGTISNGIVIGGIPAGAVITGATVNLVSFGAQYQDDYVVNIKAPNGNVLNLINQRGSHSAAVTTLYANTTLSSAAATSLATGSGTYTGTWAADAVSVVGGTPFISNITSWGGLFSTPNGTWTLAVYNNTAFTNVVVPSAQWSVTLQYAYQAPVIWSPATGLYTDAAATVPYTSTAATSVYFDPATVATTVYTATATNAACSVTATATVTVNPLPAVITGASNVCTGSNITLGNATTGGTWSSSNTNAIIGSATGVVTGVTSGTSVITYTLPTGCYVTTIITVNTTPAAITGTLSVCEGANTTLNNSITGGTWSASNTNSSIGAASGIVSGLAAGTTVITYSLTGSCYTTSVLTVNPAPAAITGTLSVCEGGSFTTLGNPVSGGTWSGSNANVTAALLSGIITGNTAGTAVVTYALPAGCYVTAVVTVDPLPATISGPAQVCRFSSITLSNTSLAGSWVSSNANAVINATTGVLTGSAAGTAVVSYILPTGCYVTRVVTVDPLPAAITGPAQVCIGSNVSLINTTSGGSWAAGNANITIGLYSAVVSGVTVGTAPVTYTLPTGCLTTTLITVNSLPAAITGGAGVCVGYTTSLSSSSAGGTWSSSNTNATAGAATGIITGVVPGTSVITYTLPTGCSATKILTINALPAAISGPVQVCLGAAVPFGNATAGGTWSTSNTARATVDVATGVVFGTGVGNVNISYTLGSGCVVTKAVTIAPLPPAITGVTGFCSGSSINLSNTVTGGTWSSSNPAIATVGGASGTVTGLVGGTVLITYTAPNGCFTSSFVSVSPSPAAITGVSSLCTGRTTMLYCLTPGGVWISSNTAVAAINATGVVACATTGIAAGTAAITYTLSSGCFTSTTMTINSSPSLIYGDPVICYGSTNLFTDTAYGGVWSTSVPSVAPVSVSGSVTGLVVGTSIISYTFPATGCHVEKIVTVRPLPLLQTVTGGGSFCAGGAGVNIGLIASQSGIRYSLLYGSITAGSVWGTGSAVSFAPAAAPGSYSVVATDTATGCQVAMTGAATVAAIPVVMPTVAIAAGASTLCEGTPVMFVAAKTNEGSAPLYSWRKNGVLIGTDDTLIYTPANGDVLSVRLTSNAVCRGIDTVRAADTLIVYPVVSPSVAVAVVPNDTVCAGVAATYVAIGAGGGIAPVYKWRVNGVLAASGTSFTATPANNDLVRCTFISNATCRTADSILSSAIRMTVLNTSVPVVNIAAAPGLSIIAGQTVTFTANAVNAGPAATYQWSVAGFSIPGATAATYTSSSLSDNDVVSCAVTGSGWCGGTTEVASVKMKVIIPGAVVNYLLAGNVQLFPDPNNGNFRLAGFIGSDRNSTASVIVTNAIGQVVYTAPLQITGGVIDSQIALSSSLTDGMYILTIAAGTDKTTMRFVVSR